MIYNNFLFFLVVILLGRYSAVLPPLGLTIRFVIFSQINDLLSLILDDIFWLLMGFLIGMTVILFFLLLVYSFLELFILCDCAVYSTFLGPNECLEPSAENGVDIFAVFHEFYLDLLRCPDLYES